MRLPRPLLRDLALVLLALVTVAAAGYVLTRSPAASRLAGPGVRPAVSPEPTPGAVQALFLGSDALLSPDGPGLAQRLGGELGWDVQVSAVAGTGFTTGSQGQRYVDRVPALLRGSQPDVVVIVASAAATEEADGRRLGGNAQFVLGAIRTARPEADVVLVGPISAAPDAAVAQRVILTGTAARFGAFLVDPVGGGYLAGRPELLTPTGALTSQGAALVADRLASDLRRVLPATIVPRPGT